MKKLLLWTWLLLLTGWLFQPVQAQDESDTVLSPATENQRQLVVASGDNPLVIRGQLDGNSTAFSGNVRLTVIMVEGITEVGSEIVPLRFLPDDLEHTMNAAHNLNRTNITIPVGTTLTVGQPQDVPVTVSNVTRPGQYTGELKFLLPGQLEEEAVPVSLQLNISARPVVTAVDTALTLQLVRCRGSWDCGLARWLLHEGVLQDTWHIQLENRTATEVEVTTAAIVMRGARTGSSVTPADISVGTPKTLPPNQVEPIPLHISRQQLAPDRYQGMVRLTVQDLNETVPVNLDITVRSGPLWPLLIIILGIVLGRLSRGMETPAAKLQLKYVRQLSQIRIRTKLISNSAARDYVDEQVKKVNQAINQVQGSADEENLKQTLETLEQTVKVLVDLEKWETKLLTLEPNNTLVWDLQPKIQAARRHIMTNQLEQAVDVYNDILAEVRVAQENQQMGDRQTDELGISVAEQTSAALATAVAEHDKVRPGKRPHWLYTATARALAALLGMQLTADVRYWLLRPLFWLVVLFGLALLGMQTLYVNAGATFGAAGIYDYLGLFLWGVAVDVSSSGLRSLQSKFSGDNEEEV
jgi:hypothetical protein